MASNSLASSPSTSSSLGGGGGGVLPPSSRRRARADSENDVLRELVKVVCECLYRTRSGPPRTTAFSTAAAVGNNNNNNVGNNEKQRKTKWFGIVSDRVQEVETQLGMMIR